MTFYTFYTQNCGTCHVSLKMIDILKVTLPEVKFIQMDVLKHPDWVKKYELSSVPAFLLFQEGKCIDIFYAAHSVTYLLQRIKKHFY